MGVDGSGKTTVAKDIQKWLSWKIDCRYVYLGTGQGKSSILNRLLRYRAQKKLSKGYVKETTEVKSESGDPKKTKGIKKAFRRTILNVVSLSNVQYKFRTIKKIDRLINKGVVVITDRYPQNEYFGINDGPTITNTGNPVLDVINNFLSRQENRIIDKTLQYHPDVIIKLIIPLEVSRSRKQDSPVALIERKIEIIGDIHYNGAAEFCVPSDTTIEETENEVKRIVWENVVAFCDK